MFKFYSTIIFIFLLNILNTSLFATNTNHSLDSLMITIEKHNLQKGDTLNFDCNFNYQHPAYAKITLNVIIENLDNTKQWKFRYPLLNGSASPGIIIGKEVPDGNYAITFLLQNDFLRMKGKIRDYSTKSKGINFLLLTKQRDSYIGFITPEPTGYFTTQKMIFEDTAHIVFSEIGKKNQYLYIDAATYLDSAYTPIAQLTQFISIGNSMKPIDSLTTKNYKIDLSEKKEFTLNTVTVKSVTKKKVELFDEEYASGLFKFGFPQIFDGIEGTQLGNSMDIFNFLQGRVAGLRVNRDNMGNYSLKWREGNVDVYLDEFKIDNEMASYVNTNDIAMIKVFPPMSGGPTGNGTIAIYTKRGAYYTENSTRRYNFEVKGYSPQLDILK